MLRYLCAFYFIITVTFVVGENAPKEQVEKNSPRDSYLDAYTESHGGNVDINKINTDREMNFPTGFNGGFPEEHFGVQHPYPAPSPPPNHYNYGPPQPMYGPPQSMYGPPIHKPPKPVYEPLPHPPYHYGPPPLQSYGIPYAFIEGLLDKFKLKWNLITILKILLKLVLFKKFVSFVAIICLLLFIPWLKAKKHHIHHHGSGGSGSGEGSAEHDEEDDDDDIMMKRNENASLGANRLNNLTVQVLEAIESFKKRSQP